MPSLKATEGYIAAQAMLSDIATNPHYQGQCRIQVLLKLVKLPQVLATMVSTTFDQVGAVPDIYGMVEFHNGQTFAVDYATSLHRINLIRRGQGRDELPVHFENEDGSPHNVIDFASYKRRRALAA